MLRDIIAHMTAHRHQEILSTMYGDNINYHKTHLRNMGTTHILCAADIRLFCYWITTPQQRTMATLR